MVSPEWKKKGLWSHKTPPPPQKTQTILVVKIVYNLSTILTANPPSTSNPYENEISCMHHNLLFVLLQLPDTRCSPPPHTHITV